MIIYWELWLVVLLIVISGNELWHRNADFMNSEIKKESVLLLPLKCYKISCIIIEDMDFLWAQWLLDGLIYLLKRFKFI